MTSHDMVDAAPQQSMLTMLKQPSAFMPLLMSITALTIVIVYVLRNGTEPQADEGAAAHTWQLLMGLQVPIIAWFAATAVPREPKPAWRILALQFAAGVAAAAPVFLLGF